MIYEAKQVRREIISKDVGEELLWMKLIYIGIEQYQSNKTREKREADNTYEHN